MTNSRNRLPHAPLKRRIAGVAGPRRPISSLERVRKLSRDFEERERPFDPSRAPTWRGSSRDLVVNSGRRRDIGRTFEDGFFAAALFSTYDGSRDDGGDPLDDNYSVSDFDPKSKAALVAECERFQRENAADIEGFDEAQAGADFWFTRCGHGVGYWDGDYPEPQATRLTEASERYGDVDLYVGDDGLIYAAGYESGVDKNYRRNSGRAYEVRLVHKISPRDADRKTVSLPESAFSDKTSLAASLRNAGLLQAGGRLREMRVEGDKVVAFPDRGIWHSFIIDMDPVSGYEPNAVDPRDVPHNLRPIEANRYRDVEMPTENGDVLRYEDIEIPRSNDGSVEWFIVGETEGGDYAGGTVAKSNYRKLIEILEEEYPDAEPAVWGKLRGGHGSQSIIVKYGDLNDEVRGIIDALTEYPLIDESDLSDLESKEESEAWERWAKDDFIRGIAKLENKDSDALEEALTDDQWAMLFRAMCSAANENWEHSSEGPYIRIKKLTQEASYWAGRNDFPKHSGDDEDDAIEAFRKALPKVEND